MTALIDREKAAADRIEQLERELAEEREMVHQLAGDLGNALSKLAFMALVTARNDALEEAAEACRYDDAHDCAAAIRALKGPKR